MLKYEMPLMLYALTDNNNHHSYILYSNRKSVSLFVILIMFDTVNFWIDRKYYVETDILESMYKNSIDVKEVYNPKYESTSYYGILKNYKVNVYPYGISLQGSIAKYLFGEDTIKFADRLSCKRGIEEISDLLGLDLNNATITRLDIGQNLELDNYVLKYYTLLLASSRLNRVEYLNSLYFKNKSKELIFYDKITERKEKGFKKFSGNLLRYELRLKKRPSNFLKTEKLFAKDLYEKPIYKQLANLWYKEYRKITKTSDNEPPLYFNNPKDLRNNLAAIALAKLYLQILKDIKIKLKKGLMDNVNAHRCRKLLIELKSIKSIKIKGEDLLKELDYKMEITYKRLIESI